MSKRTVAIYPDSTNKEYKRDWCKAFGEGVNKFSDKWEGRVINGNDFSKIDHNAEFSFVFNYQFETLDQCRKTTHKFRRKVFEKHFNDGKVFTFDGDVLISYGDMISQQYSGLLDEMKRGLRYVRIPMAHVYEPKAKFFIKDNYEERWEKIKKERLIQPQNYNLNIGDQILIVCNRGLEGYSGMGVPAWKFAIESLVELRKHTKRPITIRWHRATNGHRRTDNTELENFLVQNPQYRKDLNVQCRSLGNFPKLIDEIKKSYAVVTLGSSAATPAIIEGKPLFVKAPECYFYKWRSGELSDIENPNINIDRVSFYKKYCFSHYNYIELRNGEYWKNVKDEL